MRAVFLLLGFFVLATPAADRPVIAFVAGEFEYKSKETLPAFASELENQFELKTVVLERPDDEKVQSIPGLEALASADLLFLAVRRMTLPEEQLSKIRAYLESGKPVVAIRTSSHAFQNWTEFDALVLGGNYQNHRGNQLKTTVTIIPESSRHPILRGVAGFISDGSLYRNTPLQPSSRPLLRGTVKDFPPEPVAWTHEYKGGRVFYTSLGHPNDFKQESFRTLLINAIEWSLRQPLAKRKQ